MKIAFYLGDFDPFHNGNLKIIEAAFEIHKMDKIVIVPSFKSEWKHNKVSNFYDRASIIALSISRLARKHNIVIDYTEKSLENYFHNYDTLEKLKDKYDSKDNELYLLCERDVANSISSWEKGDVIAHDWNIIVIDTPEGSKTADEIKRMIKQCEDITPYVSKNAVKRIFRYYYYYVEPKYNKLK